MWKRIVAEVLDFMILFVLKVMITFIAVDAFDLIDLEHYDLPVAFDLLNLSPENVKLDYNFAMQLTQEILILELVHRMVVCVFEALCTHRGPLGIPGAVLIYRIKYFCSSVHASINFRFLSFDWEL